jgi:hypothetical protein
MPEVTATSKSYSSHRGDGTAIGRFALDPNENLYITSYGILSELAPGKKVPMRSIKLSPDVGLVTALAAAAQ